MSNNTSRDTIVVSGKKPICISFTSAVSPITACALQSTVADAANNAFDEIHLFLSTPGGTVHDGIAIYNIIRALPIPVRTYNMGNVNSIGNVLFQAGRHRICAEASSFMFHGVGFDVHKARMELKQLKEQTISIENDQSLIAGIMERHTSLSREDIDDLFLKMAYMSAQDAIERGIADEIRDIRLPPGLPIQQLVFQ